MQLNDEGLREGKPTYVMMDPIDRRKQQEQRNHLPIHFHTDVTTSEIDPPRKWPREDEDDEEE